MKHFPYFVITSLALTLCGCDQHSKKVTAHSNLYNEQLARREIQYYGCASCHIVPGVPGAQGLIGPSLEHFADHNFIGGVLKNNPENLVRWIVDAPSINPRTAMPSLKIPEDEAREITLYLYSLK